MKSLSNIPHTGRSCSWRFGNETISRSCLNRILISRFSSAALQFLCFLLVCFMITSCGKNCGEKCEEQLKECYDRAGGDVNADIECRAQYGSCIDRCIGNYGAILAPGSSPEYRDNDSAEEISDEDCPCTRQSDELDSQKDSL